MSQAADLGRGLLARLPGPLFALLDELGDAAGRVGGRLWLVGGAVRDLWLGEPVTDADLLVEGRLEPVLGALAAGGRVVEPKAAEFLTYCVRPPSPGPALAGVTIDLGAARRESYARPAALPTVEPGTLEEDLRRRDVSVNAIAVTLGPGGGTLADPTGGLADLAAGRLRVLHDRSFEDDPTRAFRVARFAGRYGFTLDPGTARGLERMLAAGLVGRLSAARVRAQVALLASEPLLAAPLAAHADLGLLAAAHPALAASDEARRRAVAAEEAAAAWDALGLPAGDPVGRLLRALLADRSEAEVRSCLLRLGLQGRPARRLVAETCGLASLATDLARGGLSRRALHDRLAPLEPAALVVLAGLAAPAGAATVLGWALDDLGRRRPRLGGRDLQALGVPPGPEVGRMLDRLLTERLEGRLTSRNDEVRFVRGLLGARPH